MKSRYERSELPATSGSALGPSNSIKTGSCTIDTYASIDTVLSRTWVPSLVVRYFHHHFPSLIITSYAGGSQTSVMLIQDRFDCFPSHASIDHGHLIRNF